MEIRNIFRGMKISQKYFPPLIHLLAAARSAGPSFFLHIERQGTGRKTRPYASGRR
jgi:hypothetical protein